MNKQGKGKIEWTDYTWNPIKGECPVGCWYCYARAMYRRFDWLNEGTVPESGVPGMIDEHELEAPLRLKKPSKIFICSTYEIFYQKHHSWRDGIFDVIKACPQHTFQILTKMPENIDRPMPDNVWLGVSVTGGRPFDGVHRVPGLAKHEARIRFVSIEPLLGSVIGPFDVFDPPMDWYIVGRLTGHGHKNDPTKLDLQLAVGKAREIHAPVFLKHNLKDIWPGELIQEWPE